MKAFEVVLSKLFTVHRCAEAAALFSPGFGLYQAFYDIINNYYTLYGCFRALYEKSALPAAGFPVKISTSARVATNGFLRKRSTFINHNIYPC